MKGHLFIYKRLGVLDENTHQQKYFLSLEKETNEMKVRLDCYGGISVVRGLVILSYEEDVDNIFGRWRIFLNETALVRLCLIFYLYFFYSVFAS